MLWVQVSRLKRSLMIAFLAKPVEFLGRCGTYRTSEGKGQTGFRISDVRQKRDEREAGKDGGQSTQILPLSLSIQKSSEFGRGGSEDIGRLLPDLCKGHYLQ